MPHYKNGQRANVDDLAVVTTTTNPKLESMGIIVSIQEQQRCNAGLLVLARRWNDGPWRAVTAQYPDCISLEDSLPMVAANEVLAGTGADKNANSQASISAG